MLSNSPATVSDITTEQHRALAFSLWSVGPMNSLVTGPLIGGFAAEYLGWRWNSWLLLIFAVLALLISLGIKETYAPSILQKRAAKLRKDTGDNRYWSKYDHDVDGKFTSFQGVMFVRILTCIVVKYLRDNLSRPFVLAATEPILWFWNAYIAVSNIAPYLLLADAEIYQDHLHHTLYLLRLLPVHLDRSPQLDPRHGRSLISRHWVRQHTRYSLRASLWSPHQLPPQRSLHRSAATRSLGECRLHSFYTVSHRPALVRMDVVPGEHTLDLAYIGGSALWSRGVPGVHLCKQLLGWHIWDLCC